MSAVEQKLEEVLALSAEDRAYLAQRLIESLHDEVDGNAQEFWREIERRTREIEEGKVVCIPADEVMQSLRAELNARRVPS